MLNLKTLRPFELGTGYLIEHDAGFISPKDKRNQPFINEIKNLERGNKVITEPLYVYAVLQKYGIENRNGRIYPEQVLRSQADAYQRLISERRALGELDHPESSTIALQSAAINIVEMWWEGATLMGKIEIIMSPGYVNFGIISCEGDKLANYLRLNIMVGVSSRGVGSVQEVNGIQLVQNDFEIICWDAVSNPSTPGSWIVNDTRQASAFREGVSERGIITVKPNLSTGLDKFLLG
jgi:hypothetical protein